MKTFYSFLVVFLIVYCSPIPALAQHKVTITGDPCLGNELTANISSGVSKLIKWYKDDTILALARGTWKRESTIAAGGHGQGTAANQLGEPQAIFIDDSFNLYIVDNLRVQKWAKNASSGVTVAGGNGKGTATNQFYAATGVWVDKDKNVFVSDNLTNRVVKWTPGATDGIIVAGGHGFGSDSNQLAGAGQICMDKQGNLYIADRWNDRVQKWTPGAAYGVTVAGGNGRGGAANQLSQPYSIAVDTAGNVYVADLYNHRVQKWAAGAVTGVTVAGGNGQGPNAGQFYIPATIHVDTAGNLYVADNGNYRIQKWTPGATFGITVAGGYGFGYGSDKVATCYGLCTDKLGNLYVSEISGYKVKQFTPGKNVSQTYLPLAPANYQAAVTFGNGAEIESNVFKLLARPEKPGGIQGPELVQANRTGVVYKVRNSSPDCYYTWQVPAGADITAGQGTDSIRVNFGSGGGRITVFATNICGTSAKAGKKDIETFTPDAQRKAINMEASELQVYPNPARTYASILFNTTKSEKYNVEVTDAEGRVLTRQTNLSWPGTNKINIDVSRYAKGMYFIHIITGEKGRQTCKLNKE